MKKIIKWLCKQDTLGIIMVCIVGFIWLSGKETDTMLIMCYTVFAIPIFLFLLQNAMKQKLKNNFYNIDLSLSKEPTSEMIWKSRTDSSKDDIVYLNVKNNGKVDIFYLYIKVIKHDGTVGRYKVDEILPIDEIHTIRVSNKQELIKEIVISCGLQVDCRTKKFNGLQSEKDNVCIFSNSEKFDEKKYAVCHEKGAGEFEKMERFFYKKELHG